MEKSDLYGMLQHGESTFFAAALVRRPMIGETRYQVRLFLNEKSKEFTAMVDSGNRLDGTGDGKAGQPDRGI